MFSKIVFILSLLFFVDVILADTPNDVYTVQIPVHDESEASRQAATEEALHQMVTQLANENIIQPGVNMDSFYSKATEYVESYSYGIENESNGDTSSSKVLNVRFDASAINQYFMQEGMMRYYRFTLEVIDISSEVSFQTMVNTLKSSGNTQSIVVRKVLDDVVWLTVISLKNPQDWLESIKANSHFLVVGDAQSTIQLQFLR